MASLTRRIEGGGTTDAQWRAAPQLHALPCVSAARLVPEGARAVIVAPHPDDEVLGTGGLLRHLSQLHRAILIVAVSDGEASHPDSTRWPPHELARARRQETQEALARLGVEAFSLLRAGLPDGGIAAHQAQLQATLRQHLRSDDVVFATWRLDGHPDHEATGRAAHDAAREAGCAMFEVPIWGWHWCTPDDPRMPWQHACRLELDERDLASKEAAARAFASQLAADPSTGRGPIVPPSALERLLRPFEVFFRT